MEEIEKIVLTEAEREFCELFVDGGAGFAGQAAACYKEVFGENRKNIPLAARKVILRAHVAEYIAELVEARKIETETIAVKLQVSETLKAVMAETSQKEYIDKYGMALSPAPLRAVSVNAAKALMDLYPIKHGQDSGKKGDGNNGNITFNVIVPQMQPRHEDED
ncbi:MAG: hypothetical protein RR559_06280 [Bacteroides sp.]